MVRVEVLRRRLNKLDEYLKILSRLQRYSFEEYMAEPERYTETNQGTGLY